MVDGSLSFQRLATLEAEGAGGALVTVVRVSGSTPRSAGARMLVRETGDIEGTIGGGKLEHVAIGLAKETIASGVSRFVELQLTQELGMCCGGKVALFIEPLERMPTLVVFGAGHVGAAVCRLATTARFWVVVVDARAEFLTTERLPDSKALFDDVDDPAIPAGDDTFVLVMTHDHGLDQAIVERAIVRPHRWIGLIGSRRKAEMSRERLLAKGVSPDRVARLRCPVGLAIGAETPEEIAVSIVAEIVAVKRHAACDPATSSGAGDGVGDDNAEVQS